MKKKISIITGGAGFIGSYVVELLIKKNHKVFVIDDLSGGKLKNLKKIINNKNLFFIKKKIETLKKSDLKIDSADYIYHFAGKGDIVPSIDNPESYIKTNVNGTVNILQLARHLKIKKFIYAASSSCYGLTKTRTNEKYPINCKHPYALSKYLGEQAVIHWSEVFKIPYISIRIFNAFGVRQKTSGNYGSVIDVFFKQKLMRKPLTIVGSGRQKRDYLYVTDVANAFYLSAKSKIINQIFNLGSDNPISINYLAKKISNSFIKIPDRPGEPKITWANTSKIKKFLNWQPSISFDQGIQIMLESIDEWRDAPLWDKKTIKNATKNWFKHLS